MSNSFFKYKKNKDLSLFFFKLIKYLGIKRKFQLLIALIFLFISAFFEIFTLAVTIPFLKVLTNPESLFKYKLIQNYLPNISSDQLVFPITLIFIFSILVSGSLRIYTLFMSTRLSALIGSDISKIIYSNTFYKPYNYFLEENSSKIISLATIQIDNTVDAMFNYMQLLTGLIISIFLIISIIFINFSIASSLIFTFFTLYLLITLVVKKRLLKISKVVVSNYGKQVKLIQEGLSSIREIILGNYQKYYLTRLHLLDKNLRIKRSTGWFLGFSPKYLVETIGVIAIAIIAYIFYKKGYGEIGLIPLLGTIALAAQKLLPALQQVYSNWANIKSMEIAVLNVLYALQNSNPTDINHQNSNDFFKFNKSILFQNLYFKYISNQSYILKNINLEIFKGEFIGIIGKTGDGKSTFIDLMMGLLKPSKGYIYLDNKNIHTKNNYKILRAWRKSISHVPQTINLFDSTIAENVAFGENVNQINIEEVKNACRIAMIDDFISSLKDGYFTRVGELGKKLSGGQRQRIGIARALYSKSNILVFDEATSALDVITEKKILKSIISLKNNPTVIMIAHRLTTLKEADKLVEIEKGIIKKVTVRK